ncbi:MAG TPA: alpha/beta hydrolase [Cellvibrio sp.]|nr:alpha/beta hydrolase [Cellvibrio sp.]
MHKHNLLLLPALISDDRLWEQQIAALADIATITVADLSGANSITTLAATALQQAPAGPLAIAGLSMGGYVALEIMRQAPQRISALALLDTSARADTAEATNNRQKNMQLAQTDYNKVIDELIAKLIHPSQLSDQRQINTVKAMAQSLGKDVFVRQQQAIIGRIDSRPFLKNISCPTLILCGRGDLITPVEIHEEMHSAISSSTLVVVEQCGHLSSLGQPQEVSDAMREWLAPL